MPSSEPGEPAWPSRLSRLIGRLSGWQQTRCLFGLSTGRTGTTTLERALNLSPEVVAFHEPQPKHGYPYNDAYQDLATNRARARQRFVALRAGAIGSVGRRGRVYAETNNMQYIAPVVAGLLPRAVFLFFHRHPGEYVRSGMRRRWYDGHAWDRYRLVPRPDEAAAGEWDRWSPFEKICWFWAASNREFADAVEAIGPDRTLTCSFDDLVESRGRVLGPAFDLLQIDRPSEQRLATVYERPHNAQATGQFPEYADWSPEQKARLRAIAGETMDRLGYA